ncbi:hypothetical protein V1J52_19980 [Streptomyces sp. TRM 70351]|uniref:hypothetical protein n=1 Tax=Streptomyces sp. TRM 70351 TaxID=3116552 RepID=UPI002E7B4484|nr:hypothetical protein [Streptomyces sp. TRM 70351]MEE1930435.1 hypothetical protein [Streptomyces sp. TRM 70351]
MTTTDPRRAANVEVRGVAVRHARAVICEAVPDALKVSCVADTVRCEVPEAEIKVVLRSTGERRTCLCFHAVFRERQSAGRTWWTSWEVEVPDAAGSRRVGWVLVSELRACRRSFARAVDDAGLPAAA